MRSVRNIFYFLFGVCLAITCVMLVDDEFWNSRKKTSLRLAFDLFLKNRCGWVSDQDPSTLQNEDVYRQHSEETSATNTWAKSSHPFIAVLGYLGGAITQLFAPNAGSTKNESKKIDPDLLDNKKVCKGFEYFKDEELEGPLGDLIGRPYLLRPIKPKKKTKKRRGRSVRDSFYDFNTDNDSLKRDSCNWIPKRTTRSEISFSEDRRTNKSRLRIAEFNAEWLYLHGGSGAIKCPGMKCPWKDKYAAQDHLRKVAELLTKIDADIIHLNELEGCSALSALIDQMKYKSQYRGYLTPGTDASTGQNVAIITKLDPIAPLSRTEVRVEYPVEGSKCKSSRSGSTSSSKHYLTRFRTSVRNNQTLDFYLLGCHLLAYPTDPLRCSMREAQAHALRQFLKESLKEEKTDLIILGDLNDFDDEIQVLHPNSPNSRVLKVLKASQYPFLKNVAQLMRIEERFSSWFDRNGNCIDDGIRERSLIDHGLVSENLYSRITAVQFWHEYQVTCKDRISDHWPLVIEIN